MNKWGHEVFFIPLELSEVYLSLQIHQETPFQYALRLKSLTETKYGASNDLQHRGNTPIDFTRVSGVSGGTIVILLISY
jgi:hypothetical protein